VKAKYQAEKCNLITPEMFALSARDVPFVAATPKIGRERFFF
jgi:hypothetical protein